MFTTLFTLYALHTNISYPSEEYEVGSGQNEKDYYPISTEEPIIIPDNDTYFIDENFTIDIGKTKKAKKTKKGKKTKNGKKHRINETEFSLNYQPQKAELSTSSFVAISLGGLFFVAGSFLMISNYCKRRNGYEMIQPNLGVAYGSMDNIYNGE